MLREKLLYIPDEFCGAKLAAFANTTIKRRVSQEVVFTNERGWRVRNQNDLLTFQADMMCPHFSGQIFK